MNIETFVKTEFDRLEEMKNRYSDECTLFSRQTRSSDEYFRFYSGKLIEICMESLEQENDILGRFEKVLSEREVGFDQGEYDKFREKLGWYIVKLQNEYKQENKNKL